MQNLSEIQINYISGGYDCFCAHPEEVSLRAQLLRRTNQMIAATYGTAAYGVTMAFIEAAYQQLPQDGIRTVHYEIMPDHPQLAQHMSYEQICIQACQQRGLVMLDPSKYRYTPDPK